MRDIDRHLSADVYSISSRLLSNDKQQICHTCLDSGGESFAVDTENEWRWRWTRSGCVFWYLRSQVGQGRGCRVLL